MINAFDFPNNSMKEILPIVIFHVDFLFACLFVGKVLYFSQYLGEKMRDVNMTMQGGVQHSLNYNKLMASRAAVLTTIKCVTYKNCELF